MSFAARPDFDGEWLAGGGDARGAADDGGRRLHRDGEFGHGRSDIDLEGRHYIWRARLHGLLPVECRIIEVLDAASGYTFK